MEIYGSVTLKGSLADGTGDPLLTKDASTDAVGTAANSLGTLTDAHIFVGDASDVPTDVAVSGDITISNTGVVAIATGVIVNGDVNASAAIALTKLAATTASRALVSDGSGFIVVSTTTAAEVGYVSGVTSAIQTQLNAKQATITGAASTVVSSNLGTNVAVISNGSGKLDVSAVTSTELGYVAGVTSAIQTQLNTKLAPTIVSVAEGDILMYNGSAWVNLARGTDGQTLRSSATTILWDTPTINGIPIGGTINQVLAKQSGTDFDADWETLAVASITDLTATAAELNLLDGVVATTAEINFLDNASANIQTQLDGKLSVNLTTDNILKGVAGVATATTDLPTGITIGGAVIYRVGGSDVTLADGGTGASLADPGADRIMFWDESANAVTWLAAGSGLTITDTTITASPVLTVAEENIAASNNYLLIGDITNDDNIVEIGEISTIPTIRSAGNQANGRSLLIHGEDGVSAGNGGPLLLDAGDGAGGGTASGISFFQRSSTAVFGSGEKVIFVANATVNSSTAPVNGIILHSRDSSDGSANATLALFTEQAPEATATFTQTHRLKIWLNNIEYWISLDAV